VADAALKSGAPDVALHIADVAIAKDPRDVRAMVERGDALYALGLRKESEAAYRSAISADATAPGAQVGLGRILARTDPQAAEAAFQAALKSQPNNVDALNNLGVVRDLQGRHDDAEDAYYRALMASPDSTEVQINLGVSLALAGHVDAAARLLRGIASDDNAVQAWRKELASALSIAGDATLAQQISEANTAVASAGASIPLATASPPPAPPEPVRTADQQPSPPLREVSPPEEEDLALAPAPVTAVSQTELAAIAGVAASPPVARRTVRVVDRTKSPVLPVAPRAASVKVTEPDLPLAASAVATAGFDFPVSAEAPPGGDALRNALFIQLGSLNTEADANFEWQRLSQRMGALLDGHQPVITRAEVQGRTYWRLRTFGFVSAEAAAGLCSRVKALAQRCWPGRGL
jgi:Flp pilus assembly protein TadD